MLFTSLQFRNGPPPIPQPSGLLRVHFLVVSSTSLSELPLNHSLLYFLDTWVVNSNRCDLCLHVSVKEEFFFFFFLPHMATGFISVAVKIVNSVFLLYKFGRVPIGFTGKNY